jgi:O-succinylbenzoic acid--CoA ligase
MGSLHALTGATGATGVQRVLGALEAALEGSGPALLPLPEGPASVRAELVRAFRPDDESAPLERPDLALVVPTSGSTGEPKGALLTGAALRASASATHERLGGPGRWLLALPLTHVAGLMVLVRSLDAGTAPLVVDLAGGFSPRSFAAAVDGRPRGGPPLYTSLVPTQLQRLLDAEVDLTGISAILVGGSGAPAALLERARAAGARVVTTYGMSETCGGCVYDGVPLRDVRVGLAPDGRVRLGGPMLFAGYRLRLDLTADVLDGDGMLVTQDLGRLGADGSLELLGRADEMIISGGVNVPAGSVALVLAEHPGVAACAVVGRPDPQWGEAVVAVVVPADPDHPPTLDELREHAGGRLERAALPTRLVLHDVLPLLPSGKPDRDAIRALAATQEP